MNAPHETATPTQTPPTRPTPEGFVPPRGPGRPRKNAAGAAPPRPQHIRDRKRKEQKTPRPETHGGPEPQGDEQIDGMFMHSITSSVDGGPRWNHPLFPWESKTPAQMLQYDRQDHALGQPTLIRLYRKNPANGILVSIPRDFEPAEVNHAEIQRRYGGGLYVARAFACKLVDGESRVSHVATRMGSFTLPGASKPIEADFEEEEEEEEDDEESGEYEDDDEPAAHAAPQRRASAAATRAAAGNISAELAAQVELARLQSQAEQARAEREDRRREAEQRRRDEEYRRERERDREASQAMMTMMSQNFRNNQPAAPMAADQVVAKLLELALDKVKKGAGDADGGKGTAEVLRAVLEPLMGAVGEVGKEFIKAKLAEQGIDAEQWEEEEEEEEESEGEESEAAEGAPAPAAAAAPAPPSPPPQPQKTNGVKQSPASPPAAKPAEPAAGAPKT